MAETRNIVILGASCGGLSAAHYIARHVLSKLQQSKDYKYVLHIADPSTHFWWHIGAPRAIVSVQEMKHSDYFVPIEAGFKQYSHLTKDDTLVFHQATAISLFVADNRVILSNAAKDGAHEDLGYYALVIATGFRSPTPLTTLHGSHETSQKALEEMNGKLRSAKTIVIGGGGPVGAEIAGEIATAAGLSSGAKVTLVTGAKHLIPKFRESRGRKVARKLEKSGVEVVYGTKVLNTTEDEEKKTTTVHLDNGETLVADVYIPASGVVPNTSFLPVELRKENGYVKTNPKTMRVDAAGPRVYAVGDVADVNMGGMLHLFDSVPVFGANFAHDLLTDAKIGAAPPEKTYIRKDGETQLVPIGRKAGVGAFNGTGLPGFMVSMFKGKDYMKGQIPKMTTGTQWKKP